jgi:hypothetical protein
MVEFNTPPADRNGRLDGALTRMVLPARHPANRPEEPELVID